MDEMLNYVTNRAGGFASVAFPVRSSYQPADCPAVVNTMRELMGLTRNDTDYFVHALMTLLTIHTDLASLFTEQDKSYDLSVYRPQPPSVTGAILTHDHQHPPGINRICDEWPVRFEMQLRQMGNAAAELSLGSVYWPLVTAVSGDTLHADWPAASGITGSLRSSSGAWSGSTTVRLFHTPLRFPSFRLRGALLEDTDSMAVLSDTGFVDAFVNTASDARAVAIATAALAEATRKAHG